MSKSRTLSFLAALVAMFEPADADERAEAHAAVGAA